MVEAIGMVQNKSINRGIIWVGCINGCIQDLIGLSGLSGSLCSKVKNGIWQEVKDQGLWPTGWVHVTVYCHLKYEYDTYIVIQYKMHTPLDLSGTKPHQIVWNSLWLCTHLYMTTIGSMQYSSTSTPCMNSSGLFFLQTPHLKAIVHSQSKDPPLNEALI